MKKTEEGLLKEQSSEAVDPIPGLFFILCSLNTDSFPGYSPFITGGSWNEYMAISSPQTLFPSMSQVWGSQEIWFFRFSSKNPQIDEQDDIQARD